MKPFVEYKEYVGAAQFTVDDKVFFGKLEGIRDVVTFEADTIEELGRAFRDSVNDYLVTCKKLGKVSDKQAKG